ncbi:MAG: amino acid permease [Bacteroidales bacterium]|nr:amino acid permease [Bacteroidales bacterium]
MSDASRNGLIRRLGLFSVVAIIVADMVGTGIFTTSGLLMENLRSPVMMVVLWSIGGFIALSGAFCYAELSAAMPYAGGEYYFLSRLFHPLPGFLSGWVSFIVGFSAPVAAASIGMSEYLLQAFPQWVPDHLVVGIPGELFARKGYAVGIILVFTLLHIQGLKLGAHVHNVLTIIKLALILGMIILGFSSGEGSFEHFSQNTPADYSFGGFKNMGLSVMWILFAYSGWNAAAYIGSEVKNPSRNLPAALILGTGIVIMLYMLLNVFFIYAIPPGDMEGVISVGGLAIRNLFGDTYGRIFSLLIAVALFSSVSALIILGPRIYYAMARQGHFFRFAGRIHPRTGIPYLSVIIQGGVAIVIVFAGAFNEILTYMGFALGIFPILAVYGIFVLHRKGLSSYRAPGHPFFPLFFMISNLAILVLGYAERPVESSIALGTILIGIPLYYIFKKVSSARGVSGSPHPDHK